MFESAYQHLRILKLLCVLLKLSLLEYNSFFQCSKICSSAVHLKAHRDYHRRLKIQKQGDSSGKDSTTGDATAPLVEPYIITQQGLVQGPPRHRSVYQPTRSGAVHKLHNRCYSTRLLIDWHNTNTYHLPHLLVLDLDL